MLRTVLNTVEMGIITGIARLPDCSTIVALYQGATEGLGFQVDTGRNIIWTLTKALGFQSLSSLRPA